LLNISAFVHRPGIEITSCRSFIPQQEASFFTVRFSGYSPDTRMERILF
jgi:hypothetical protein